MSPINGLARWANSATLCSVAVVCAVALSPANVQAQDALDQTSIDFAADIELDFDAVQRETDVPGDDDDFEFVNGGRVRVTVTGEHTLNNHFIRGRTDGLLKVNGDTAVDDAWVEFGSDAWSAKFGRFEGIDLFPKGKDTVLNFAGGNEAQVYQANLARGRASDAGQIALFLRPSDGLSLEVDTIYGDPGDNTKAFSGIRPSLTAHMGSAKVTVGGEWIRYDLVGGAEIDSSGLALTANFAAGAASINANVAYLDSESGGGDIDVTTFGLNVVYDNMGLGVIHSTTDYGAGSDPSVTAVYGAYTVPIFDFDRASATFGVSYSTADDVSATVEDEVLSFRLRLNYTF